MVNALKRGRFLDGEQVPRLLDHANKPLVTARVAADRADGLFRLGEMEADLAVPDLLLGRADGLGQLKGLFRGTLEKMVSETLG